MKSFLDRHDERQLLKEQRVASSWMQDIIYRGRQNSLFPGEELILFKVKNNKKVYIVRGLRKKDYLDWINASSKGKYFRVIQQKYDHSWFYYAPQFTIIKFSKVEPTGL